jgi:Uncharacterized protein conserved in bacteria
MEYIILGILVINLIILVVIATKKKDETNVTDRLGKLELSLIKELGDFKLGINRNITEDTEKASKNITENFEKLNKNVEHRLNQINDRVNERLDENFEKTNKTFTSVLERLTKIDEAQKKIDALSTDIVSLQSILTDKKTRGIFGEVNLKNIMASIFGEKNDKVYKMQYSLPNSTIVDCCLFAPEPLGTIGIDSKFPLENYRTMVDRKINAEERKIAEKSFKIDMKKHIDAIADKYIIREVTSDQAILFLPAEAIFAEVSAYHPEIIEYAYKRRVWITSPTTLISTLTTIEVIMKNSLRDKYTSIIHKELSLLSDEFKRYKDRWDKLARSIDSVSKDVKDIHTTTSKITKRFESVNSVEIKKFEKIEEDNSQE